MLALVVLVQEVLGGRRAVAADDLGVTRHLGNLLHHDGVVDGLRGIAPPAEGATPIQNRSNRS